MGTSEFLEPWGSWTVCVAHRRDLRGPLLPTPDRLTYGLPRLGGARVALGRGPEALETVRPGLDGDAGAATNITV